MKLWKVTAHLNYDASNIQSVTIKANTRRKAYENGKAYFQKDGAFKVNIETVKEIDENTVEFLEAVEIIQKYCQFEDCDKDCRICPYSLAIIRCADKAEEEGKII